MAANVCVVGSIRMDFVVRAPRFPRSGETISGDGFAIHPGGKGANQAVAASRMGAQVSLIGCIGDDEWGSQLRAVLTTDGVDIHNLRTVERVPTGVGVITVVPGGDYSLVISPGANARFGPSDVDEATKTIRAADVLVLQAEIPAETSARAIAVARESNTQVLMNAAPAEGLPADLLRQVDLLVVSRADACSLVGDEAGETSPAGLARRLASLGPERVVVTLGAEGAIHFNGEEVKGVEAFPVDIVDRLAAGDAFVGALAVLRGEGARLRNAVRLACAAGALATSAESAMGSLPTRERVEVFARRKGAPKGA